MHGAVLSLDKASECWNRGRSADLDPSVLVSCSPPLDSPKLPLRQWLCSNRGSAEKELEVEAAIWSQGKPCREHSNLGCLGGRDMAKGVWGHRQGGHLTAAPGGTSGGIAFLLMLA